MAKPDSQDRAVADDFAGQVSAAGTESKSPGAAALQVNLTANTAGELRVRPGLKVVEFEN